jgi:hypothetical protein
MVKMKIDPAEPVRACLRVSGSSGRALPIVFVLAGVLAGNSGTPVAGAEAPVSDPQPTTAAWPVYQAVEPVGAVDSPWVDVVLGPAVFTSARRDLGDLRLWTEQGRSVSYALRVRRPAFRVDPKTATVFNRADGPDLSSELSLDLGADPAEHNEVVVELPGQNFRRRAELEGSDDNSQWRQLATDYLIRFHVDRPPPESPDASDEANVSLEDIAISYPPSRFRYLRLRVYPDPVADAGREPPRVPLDQVTVQRRVAVPGELLTLPGQRGPRTTLRAQNAAASAWIIELGGENVPVSRVDVAVSEASFVRDYEIQWGGPPDELRPFEPAFHTVARGTWRRQTEDAAEPLVAEFDEVLAARLRLIVIDHGNPPLDVGQVTYSAAVRQIVVPAQDAAADGLRLYYGNLDAEDPQYDFERNLPDRLEPPPTRTELGPQQNNPVYQPEPPPLTERWPWLIYTVLGGVSLLLAGLLISVGGTAVRQHDRRQQQASGDE